MGLLLLIAAAVMAGSLPGQGGPVRGQPKIDAIRWQITEGSRELGHGSKIPRKGDIKKDPKRGYLLIGLSNHFTLSIPRSDVGSGFGIVATRDDMDTFCWEWFNVDRPGHAVKLQETGELAFTTRSDGSLMRVTFLTDVSCRVNPLSDAPDADPKWRVRIHKGSVITLPQSGSPKTQK